MKERRKKFEQTTNTIVNTTVATLTDDEKFLSAILPLARKVTIIEITATVKTDETIEIFPSIVRLYAARKAEDIAGRAGATIVALDKYSKIQSKNKIKKQNKIGNSKKVKTILNCSQYKLTSCSISHP